jgi:INO80 complex subunit C
MSSGGSSHFDRYVLPKSLADTLSYLHVPKRFKNSNYIRQGSKRNRTVKQLLSGDREREKAYHEQTRVNATQVMQLDQTPATLPLDQVFCDCFLHNLT